MKKLLVFVFAVIMIISISVITVFADFEDAGDCGPSAEWFFDSDTGVLTVSGKGKMDDYSFYSDNLKHAPWYQYKDKVLSVVVEEGITSIGNNGFYSMRSLREISLPSTLTSMGEQAFAFCVNLKSITIPEGVSRLEASTFSGCIALTAVNLPKSISYIQYLTFSNCTSLDQITVHQRNCTIIQDAFFGCDDLKIEGYIGSSAHMYAQIYAFPFINIETGKEVSADNFEEKSAKCGDNAYFVFDAETGTLTIFGSGPMYDYCYVPGQIKQSPWYTYNRDIKHVVIEDGITKIGEYAFYMARELETLTMTDSVTMIANHGVNNCMKLKSIKLSRNITEICDFAFGYAQSLKSIDLPKKLERIGANAFVNCTGLKEITFPDGLKYIDPAAFNYCFGLEEVIIPKSVIKIGTNAFGSCSKLTIYGYMMTAARNYALSNNVPFKEMKELPATEGKCGDGIDWSFNEHTGELRLSGSGRMYEYSYVLHGDSTNNPLPWDGLKELITAVRTEGNIVNISNHAFRSCKKLKTVELGEGTQEIGKSAFAHCTELYNLILPSSLETISDSAFLECQALESITIPNEVTLIGESAFANCSLLSEVILPKRLEKIGKNAFMLCEKLETIDIPYGVTAIGDSVFASCSSLVYAFVPDTVTALGRNPFNKLKNVTVYTDSEYVRSTLEKDGVKCADTVKKLKSFEKTGSYEGQFKDVKDSDWFVKNVKGAYESGLMLGTSETEFSPTQNITVAQVVTLAARIHSIYYTGKTEFEQGDVWYQVYADYLKNHIYGYTTLVSPSDYDTIATREKVVKILYSALPKGTFTPVNSIAEIPDYRDTTGAVMSFYNAGILTGSDAKGSFMPESYITRAEIAAIVTRMIDTSLRVKLQ